MPLTRRCLVPGSSGSAHCCRMQCGCVALRLHSRHAQLVHFGDAARYCLQALTGAGPSSQPAVCCEQVADAFTVPGAPLETPGSSNLHTQQQQASAFSQESLLKVAERQGHRLPETHEQQKKFLAKLTHLHLNGLQLQQLSSLKLCPQLQVIWACDQQHHRVSHAAAEHWSARVYIPGPLLAATCNRCALGPLKA